MVAVAKQSRDRNVVAITILGLVLPDNGFDQAKTNFMSRLLCHGEFPHLKGKVLLAHGDARAVVDERIEFFVIRSVGSK